MTADKIYITEIQLGGSVLFLKLDLGAGLELRFKLGL